jgi:hypothetical protein
MAGGDDLADARGDGAVVDDDVVGAVGLERGALALLACGGDDGHAGAPGQRDGGHADR